MWLCSRATGEIQSDAVTKQAAKAFWTATLQSCSLLWWWLSGAADKYEHACRCWCCGFIVFNDRSNESEERLNDLTSREHPRRTAAVANRLVVIIVKTISEWGGKCRDDFSDYRVKTYITSVFNFRSRWWVVRSCASWVVVDVNVDAFAVVVMLMVNHQSLFPRVIFHNLEEM